MTFDPKAIRQAIEAGRMLLSVEESIETFRPNAVGSAAVSSLAGIISAWLVGERARVASSLRAAIAWLEDAESRDERFGEEPWFHALRRKRALAIARWMDQERHQGDLWRAAAHLGREVWQRGQVPERTFAELYLADHLLDCLLAGESGKGVAAWDHVAGGSSDSQPDDAVFAAACCRAFARGNAPGADFMPRAEAFLRGKLEQEWLGRGAYLRAAAWLAFVYGRVGLIHDPEAVLLKAFDLIPDVDMPPKVK